MRALRRRGQVARRHGRPLGPPWLPRTALPCLQAGEKAGVSQQTLVRRWGGGAAGVRAPFSHQPCTGAATHALLLLLPTHPTCCRTPRPRRWMPCCRTRTASRPRCVVGRDDGWGAWLAGDVCACRWMEVEWVGGGRRQAMARASLRMGGWTTRTQPAKLAMLTCSAHATPLDLLALHRWAWAATPLRPLRPPRRRKPELDCGREAVTDASVPALPPSQHAPETQPQ